MTRGTTSILVLGGFGFIGRNLIAELLSASDLYSLIVFDSAAAKPGLLPEGRGAKTYQGDFTKEADLERVFKENKVDVVVHLVSTTIPNSSNGPGIVWDIDSNLVPTMRLLGLMKKYGATKIVFASSGGTVYGIPKEDAPGAVIAEDHSNFPICSHGIVKLTIEKYLHMFQYLHGIDYLVLRISNPYGEYHSSTVQGLLNVVLRNVILGRPVTIWGDGEIVRDYIYIGDCTKVIRFLIEKGVSNEILNVGTGLGHSVNEVLKMVISVVGGFEIHREGSRKCDVPRVVLDVSKLRSLMPFEPTSIEIGIKKTYAWLLENR